jgi:mRNA interferase HicA
MNSAEFIKLLKKHGCTFENHRGGSGHQTVRRGDKKTVVSMHGSGQDLGKGYVQKVMKQLGIKT